MEDAGLDRGDDEAAKRVMQAGTGRRSSRAAPPGSCAGDDDVMM